MAERCCWVEIWSEGVLSCIACVIEAISVRLNEEWIEVRVVVSGIMKEGVIIVESCLPFNILGHGRFPIA